MVRALVVALTLGMMISACGPEPLAVEFRSSVAWTQQSDAESRVRALADRAAQFWGGDLDQLDGWLVIVQDGTVQCGDSVQVGCTEFWPLKRITLSALAGEGWHPSCAEQTLLAHEVGHAILYDVDHSDPRWAEIPNWQLADAADHPDCL